MEFDKLKERIKQCTTKQALDSLRIDIVRFVPKGGTIEDFYKLQKIFKTQKNKIRRN